MLVHSTSPDGNAPPPKFQKFVDLTLAGTGASLAPNVRYVYQKPHLKCKLHLIQNLKKQVNGIR